MNADRTFCFHRRSSAFISGHFVFPLRASTDEHGLIAIPISPPEPRPDMVLFSLRGIV
jgi:hypothetical protein